MKFLLLLSVCVLGLTSNVYSKVIFCYYGSWAAGRPGNGQFSVSDINPNLCTHITYSFIGLSDAGHVKLLDSGSTFPSFINLKRVNPAVKLLISMGGWNEGSEKYSRVLNSPILRATLVNSVYDFVTRNNFDGFDFDWEYPGLRGGNPTTDKYAYVDFLHDLHAKFTGKNLLITAAVGATNYYIQTSYDIQKMNRYLDFINIMSYDFRGAYDGITGQTSPLYASSLDSNKELNQHSAILAYLSAGADPNKIVMGVAFYGRTYKLYSQNQNHVGAISTGPGIAGPYTNEAGLLSYVEICEQINRGGWTVIWDNEQKNPYAYNRYDWIGYDNAQSIRGKAEYVLQYGLAGIMVWSIESDDKLNVCGGGRFPLLTAINQVFQNDVPNGDNGSTSTTTATQTTTTTTARPPPSPTTTAAPPPTTTRTTSIVIIDVTTTPASPNPGVIDCYKNLVQRDPYNCAAYYVCVRSDYGWIIQKQVCPNGLFYDLRYKMCLFAAQVNCNN